jgi:hypothetical protein
MHPAAHSRWSIVPNTVLRRLLNTGTIISDRVVGKAVRYRRSSATSPTLTVFFSAIAAPVKPLVMGKVGTYNRRTRATPSEVPYYAMRPVYIVKTNPPIVPALPKQRCHDMQSASAIRRIRNNILEPDQKLVVSSCHWSVLVCGSGSRLVTRPLLKFSNSVYKTSDVCIVAALPRILRDA